MGIKKPVGKQIKRSNKVASRKTLRPSESRGAAHEAHCIHKQSDADSEVPVRLHARITSFAERVQLERERILKALSLVMCCKYATGTKYVVDDQEYMIPVFEAVGDLLDDAAEELERIAKGW